MSAQRGKRVLTSAQRRLLVVLADGDTRTTTELAAGARSRAGTTTALRALTRLGYVTGRALGSGWYSEYEYRITDQGREAA